MQNGKKVYIRTWGCQMNEHKSEGIAGVLAKQGYELTYDPAEADLAIFNTCMVREKAEEKVYSEAGVIRKYKEKKPDLLLGVGGCVAQALKGELFKKNGAIDFIFGTSNITDIPRLLEESRRRTNGLLSLRCYRPVMAIEKIPDRIEEMPFVRVSEFQAKVTITEGCSHFCSFCIVPYTMGPLRSRPINDILAEVKELAQQGYKEVQLLGQNVDSYGNDVKNPNVNFANLLRRITHIDIPRIRFISSHPKDITPGVLEVMGQKNNICEHIHMAVQAGSDRILESMRRGYTKKQFLKLVKEIKEGVPGVNITTDIIVGYPTETEADFQETVDLVEKARFGGAFIFKYSPRRGTISYYKHKDDVPPEEKQRRLEVLLNSQKRIVEEENKKRIGQTVEVLVEGVNKPDSGLFYGKTRDNKTVVFGGKAEMIGQFAHVKVTDASVAGLMGQLTS